MMALSLPDAAADRLAKFCGLLGSDADGERATAARMATRLLRDHGLTWANLVEAATRDLWQNRYHRTPPPENWERDRAFCMRHSALLTVWEIGFLTDISARRSISDKQRVILNQIIAKVREATR